jgi:protein TonB
MPTGREDRRGSVLASLVLHGLVLALAITPAMLSTDETIERIEQGAGGPGPAGGGGGGRRGTGGSPERVRFVAVAPPPPQPVAVVPTPQPVVVPPPKPVVTPPPVPEPVVPELKIAESKPADVKPPTAVAATPGTGGGSGTDGSTGSGPGSGGGAGSGIGTGRGSGVGPGTGGGSQVNYSPQPIEFFLPPLPPPNKVKGFELIAEFDVDSTGRVVEMKFTPTPDGGYNRKLNDILKSLRFRPGTTPDGRPVRMKAQIAYKF